MYKSFRVSYLLSIQISRLHNRRYLDSDCSGSWWFNLLGHFALELMCRQDVSLQKNMLTTLLAASDPPLTEKVLGEE